MILSNLSLKLSAVAVVLALILAAPSVAPAAPITVPDASFETPSVSGGIGPFSGLDWQIDGPAGLLGTGFANPTNGIQTSFAGTGAPAAIYQDLGLLLPNTHYTLTVDIVSRNDTSFPGSQGALSLINGTSDSLVLPNVLLAQTTGFFQPAQNASSITKSVQYTTGPSVSGDLTIVLAETTPFDGNQYQMLFDNVRLDGVSTVPEPASLVLLGLAAVGLAFFARRRKSN